MNIPFSNGSSWPVDPKFNPVCGFDQDGKPSSLVLSGEALKVAVGSSALPTGAATEATLADHHEKTFGGSGETYLADLTAHTGDWYALTAVEDAVIASVTTPNGTYTGVPCPAGLTLPLRFTAITLTSGKIFAWNV